MNNTLLDIYPYKYKNTWVFDDERVGLVREPFVLGVPEMLDHLVSRISNAKHGFRLIFSASPFPQYSQELCKMGEDSGGNWYKMQNYQHIEGWFCSALYKYFTTAPDTLYLKAEKLVKDKPWWKVW